MFAKRIAQLARRLGIPLPSQIGDARLGLAGSVRVTRPIPISLTKSAEQHLQTIDPGLDDGGVIAALNMNLAWTWIEPKGNSPETLARCSTGDLSAKDFSLIVATSRWTLRSVPERDGLRVIGVAKPRRVPYARLLLARFAASATGDFDAAGLCTLIASQTRLREVSVGRLVREEAEDRGFITDVRRYLETLRDHAIASTPRARYELVGSAPVRLRTVDGDVWPRAFTRPGTLIQVPVEGSQPRTFGVVDVSDDGDVLSLDADAGVESLVEQGELQLRPGDDSIKRMREALDSIAMGTDEAHGRLLAALTRPESLEALTASAPAADRQHEAIELALNTTDVALIHGPPGTGKTKVICDLVEHLVRQGKRVLLVAPTHVALDNVLERVGDRPGVTAIRLGSPDNVEEQAQRFLLHNRSRDLARRLVIELQQALSAAPAGDAVAAVQREWAAQLASDDEVASLLLLNANLVCATPIGLAMAREFREVEVAFDVMILDEASKATITDFLVPAARARKWILVGDHRQLAPYLDLDELEAVVTERVKRAKVPVPNPGWVRELSTRLRQHFENRMHPDAERRARAWRDLVEELLRPFSVSEESVKQLVDLKDDPEQWREAKRSLEDSHNALRLGAELLELERLALPSVFEHLTRLPASRMVRLNLQHRMKPELAAFSSELVYSGDYPSAPETAQLGLTIPSLEAPSIWLDTAFAPPSRRYEHPRDTNWTGGAYTNQLELDVTLELVETCAEWAVHSWRGERRGPGTPFEIGVVAFYLQQALRLRDAIFKKLRTGADPWRRHWGTAAANGGPIDVHVSIVDRFQGREKDLVILCTTRSNPAGRRGHVDNLNRLNVAVTRARHKRIVVGDSTTLAGQEPGQRRDPKDLLRRLFETSEQKKKWGRALGGQR